MNLGYGVIRFHLLKLALTLALAGAGLTACSKTPEAPGPSTAPPSTPGTPAVSPVVITSPVSGVVSSLSQLTISGTCLPSATVMMEGADQKVLGCTTGAFSFVVGKSVDGSYTYSIRQGFSSSRVSSPVSVVWNRDATPPAAPVITVPSSNPYYLNGSSVTISGTCENGAVVTLSGSASASVTCASSTFSFPVNKSVDASYLFNINQTDSVGNISQTASLQWIRDTSAPAVPTITTPSISTYTSAESTIEISGGCETGALVQLSGAGTDSELCVASAYRFDVSQSTDGVYNYSVRQTDRAGNASSQQTLQWQRTTAIPSTPVVTFPSASPYYSNASSITLTGTCTDGHTVNLTGSATDSMTCASSAFSFTVNKGSDATYTFSVTQTSPSLSTSAAASASWIRDTSTPSAPVITTPSSSPYYSSASTLNLSGTCETGATVTLSGGGGTTTCVGSAFTFSVSQVVDGSYSYSVTQTDLAGNTSAAANQTWTLDSEAPAAVSFTSPTTPYLSNGGSLTINGTCESAATVNVTGSSTTSTVCSGGVFSVTLSKSSDGSYSFIFTQTDLSSNTSPSRTFAWVRDTVAPSAPTISSPATNPYTSAGSTLAISGGCETGATVNLAGSGTASTTCVANSYSLSVNKGSDGTYNFTISQTDGANNTSSNASLQWVRSSAIPATPIISSPSANPYYSNSNSITITGSCTTGYTVELSGSSTGSTTCASSTFSLSPSKSSDGTYSFNIRQTSLSGVSSAQATVVWTRDTSAPASPTITAPVPSPVYTNTNSITITGACESGATVNVSGDASASGTCTASAYSLAVSKSSDGTYSVIVRQTDVAGNISGSVSLTWIRDTLSPAPVSIYSPLSNPFASGDTTIAINGNCELGSTVSVAGSATASTACTALGKFSVNSTKSTDGPYNYSFTQTDKAGNVSAAFNFQWIRDTSVPSTPVIALANPYYSNADTVNLVVSCDAGLTPSPAVVNLYGDLIAGDVTSPAGALSQNCTSSPVTFTVQKTSDDVYEFFVDQENPNASTISNASSVQWIRDTSAPSAPTIITPTVSPFNAPGNLTIHGACELDATVNLSGDSTQSVVCDSTGNYDFSVIKSVDAQYTFAVKQTDRAGNISSSATQVWNRSSTAVAPPVITSPSANPLTSNSPSLTISGTCDLGYSVTLGGNVIAAEVTSPAGQLTQTCVGGTFSFIIGKSSDGAYGLNFIQTANGVNSSQVNFTWNRDTTAPTVTITASPPSTNISSTASFTFSSNEAGSTFSCRLDSAAFATCTSPKVYTSISNASHTFEVRAVDSAGNVGTVNSYTWTQASYLSLALYHLNSTSPTLDSGNYSNTLTATGSPANDASGKYPTSLPSSRSFGSGVYYSAASNSALNAGTSTMTIEGFVKMSTSISTTGNYYTLVSKTSNASPNFGWEVRLVKSSSTKYRLDFVGSLTGTAAGTTVSSTTFSLNTGTWSYFAVTWDKGTVKFYFGSTSAQAKGTRTIGTAGSAQLASTTAPLRLGANATSGTNPSMWLAGSLDEVRISQSVRTIVFPTAEFSPD